MKTLLAAYVTLPLSDRICMTSIQVREPSLASFYHEETAYLANAILSIRALERGIQP